MTSCSDGATPRIVVNIPILNEIENIDALVTRVSKTLNGYDYTLLIVDDGSTDGTLDYLSKACAANPRIHVLKRKKTLKGCQRGAALLAGVEWALGGDYEIFIEMDGDLSHVPEEMPEGIAVIAQRSADVVIGSKYVPGSRITGRTWDRTLISLICNFGVRAAIRWSILDFSNGYRYYNRAAASLVVEHEIRYGSPIYLSEALAIWLSRGMRVAEIPSHYVGRFEGLSKVRFRDYVKAVIGILEISSRYRLFGFPKRREAFGQALRAAAGAGAGAECRVEIDR